jgi:tRNA threonylcarbamoyladenosine biosynthesis protein TsaE
MHSNPLLLGGDFFKIINMKFEIENLKESKTLIDFIFKKIPKERIFLFIGELGSGKTTYIKLLAKRLKIKEVLQSPTFILWQKYEFFLKGKKYYLNHLDLYRIKKAKEILKLDLKKEIKDKKNIFLIEWGEKIENYLKRKKINFVKVMIKIISFKKRIVEVK